VAFHLTLALIGPWLAPYSPTEFHLVPDYPKEHKLSPPTSLYWLGTDQFGRDLLSRMLTGARSLIVVSVAGSLLGIAMGTAVGMSSGYKGGRVDEVVMRVMDGLMSFPSLLLALLVLTTLGARTAPVEGLERFWQELLIVVTIGIVFMPRVARVMRSTMLALKNLEFVQSAHLRGEAALYIIFREILPNALPVLGVEASVRLSYSILLVSSLGFLGLGVQPPSPDWGLMIGESRRFLVVAPWVALVPAAAVASLVVGVNLLADGIAQASGLPQERRTT
jgi:peptide/nickel transport system permease protein